MIIRILLVDDQALFREGLRTLLSVYDDLTIIGEANNGQEAVDFVAQDQPDVILMDIDNFKRINDTYWQGQKNEAKRISEFQWFIILS